REGFKRRSLGCGVWSEKFFFFILHSQFSIRMRRREEDNEWKMENGKLKMEGGKHVGPLHYIRKSGRRPLGRNGREGFPSRTFTFLCHRLPAANGADRGNYNGVSVK